MIERDMALALTAAIAAFLSDFLSFPFFSFHFFFVYMFD